MLTVSFFFNYSELWQQRGGSQSKWLKLESASLMSSKPPPQAPIELSKSKLELYCILNNK